MRYTDPALISAHVKRALTDNEMLTLSVFIPAIQRWIDNYIGTTFLPATEATSRYFDGDGTESLDIDPFTELEEIASIDGYTGSDNYLYNQNDSREIASEPANSSVQNELRYRNGGWPRGVGNIRVKAKFSSYVDGIPEDITMAATLFAAQVLTMGSSGTDNVKSESLEGHSVTYNDPATMLETIASKHPIIAGSLAHYKELMI